MQAWWEHQYMVGVGIGLRCLPKFGVDTSPCPQGRLYIVSWKKISAILIILCSCYEAVLWSFFKKNPLLLSNLIKGQSGFMFWLNSWREGDYLKKKIILNENYSFIPSWIIFQNMKIHLLNLIKSKMKKTRLDYLKWKSFITSWIINRLKEN